MSEAHLPKVQIGARITILDTHENEESSWTLVDPAESDPARGRISVHAPLAQGLLGRRAGEEVRVRLPMGERTFKIVRAETGS